MNFCNLLIIYVICFLINKAIFCVTKNAEVSIEKNLNEMVIENLPAYVLKQID